jgi:hypothetical protein
LSTFRWRRKSRRSEWGANHPDHGTCYLPGKAWTRAAATAPSAATRRPCAKETRTPLKPLVTIHVAASSGKLTHAERLPSVLLENQAEKHSSVLIVDFVAEFATLFLVTGVQLHQFTSNTSRWAAATERLIAVDATEAPPKPREDVGVSCMGYGSSYLLKALNRLHDNPCWQKNSIPGSAGTRPLRSCTPKLSGKAVKSQDNTLTGTITAGQVNRQHALVILHFGTIRVLLQSRLQSGERH